MRQSAPMSTPDHDTAAYRPITPARLSRNESGVPFSEAYGDVYHSAAGALGQARHVFLAGNGLPQRWQGRERFTVVETGFGIGLNFLATWAAWKADGAACARLHFVSLEKHPFAPADLAELHGAHPELAGLAAQLQAQWPLLTPGVHRLHFEGGRVTLTLLFGDAQELLPQLRLAADAFYLDGFSPAKNPELWSPFVFRGLARCAAAGATLATWSVAAGVREGLQSVGFVSDKAPGFGGKRDMLRGQYRGPGVRQTALPGKRILIIGAGFAGTSVAHRLAERGYRITLLDQASGPGCGASGNRVGVLRPLPSLDDNRLSRLTRSAFLYTRRHLQALSGAGLPVRWGASGVLHLARDKSHEATQRQVAQTFAAPKLFRYVDAA
ncbi:MAG TPA: tRNA (5-methylaminomethyl-2-thiouridine)(34)-methyltransferase MnmD, partial [Azospira sp.]|nr:tRNA (5-methylaminomethyl-2-thiouridine)(34)-methyltransferase MnmD [Azospira sp.]